jgi:signal transduction histidine kinase
LIIREGQTFRIAEISDDPRRYGFPPHHPEMHSFLGVPVTVKGHAVGDLYLTNKQGAPEFSEDDQRLVERFAAHAGLAIENARLSGRVQALAVVEERERIGRDLHDSTLQSLYGIALTLESARATLTVDPTVTAARMEQSLAAMSRVANEIRGFVQGLHATATADRPLAEMLASAVGEVSAGGTIPVRLVIQDGTADLPEADRAQAVLIVREALANVIRHSGANRAEVLLDGDAETIRAAVHDTGCGFDPDARRARGQGLGNMAARAAAIGGRLTITSSSGAGTIVEIVVPRRESDRDKERRSHDDPSRAPAHR